MKNETNAVFLPKETAQYPTLNRLTKAFQHLSPEDPLEALATEYGNLDKLCEESIERHTKLLDYIRNAEQTSASSVRSNEIADASLPIVAGSIAHNLARCEQNAEAVEAQINALQRAMMDVEASVFHYQPKTDKEAINQLRFLCRIVDYLNAEELPSFIKAVVNATDVLSEPCHGAG